MTVPNEKRISSVHRTLRVWRHLTRVGPKTETETAVLREIEEWMKAGSEPETVPLVGLVSGSGGLSVVRVRGPRVPASQVDWRMLGKPVVENPVLPAPVAMPPVPPLPPVKPRGEAVKASLSDKAWDGYFTGTEAKKVGRHMRNEWRKAYEQYQPLGYEPFGSAVHCVYTGMAAFQVDHVPSRRYVQKKGGNAYGGRRLLVAAHEKANAHKSDFGSECLWQCALRIAYQANRNQKDRQLAAEIVSGVERLWSEQPLIECPCIRCRGMSPKERFDEIRSDPVTFTPVHRGRKKSL